MRPKQNIILGISPGTRSIGYAILSDGELIDWGLKFFKGKWSIKREVKIKVIIESIIWDYRVSRIAMKVSQSVELCQNLEQIYTIIHSIAKNNQMRISEYSINEIKKNTGGVGNKKEAIAKLKEKFPELSRDNQRMTDTNFIRKFEAIAVTLI